MSAPVKKGTSLIDVCLILEGTYPFVAGGVSTWVHQLVSAMSDVRFGIVYIAPNSDPTRTPKYEVPPQVLSLREICLHDYDLRPKAPRHPRAHDFDTVRRFYRGIARGELGDFPAFASLLRGESACLDIPTVFSSREVWDILVELYEDHAAEESFLDFFWTWRSTHLPLMQVLTADIPRASVYHAVSTGYAGLVGAVARAAGMGRFLLTEHGIYTHERFLEITQADWIRDRSASRYRVSREQPFFRKWWTGLFSVMSRLAYAQADRIFTLFEGNRTRQILEGADPDKIRIIPNGIAIAPYRSLDRRRKPGPHVGLIGRVVAIKDVKTFIRACRIIAGDLSEARFYVVGPLEEEEEYVAECRALVEAYELADKLVFTGRDDVMKYYAFLDVVVLTSVSEAQPYVILEANACGIPVVATDVGACREMLEGSGAEDAELGPSGSITPAADPGATAGAVLKLVRDGGLYEAFAMAGRKRVGRYYDQDDLLSRYLNIYEGSERAA